VKIAVLLTTTASPAGWFVITGGYATVSTAGVLVTLPDPFVMITL